VPNSRTCCDRDACPSLPLSDRAARLLARAPRRPLRFPPPFSMPLANHAAPRYTKARARALLLLAAVIERPSGQPTNLASRYCYLSSHHRPCRRRSPPQRRRRSRRHALGGRRPSPARRQRGAVARPPRTGRTRWRRARPRRRRRHSRRGG
jgi:hypothetical protein